MESETEFIIRSRYNHKTKYIFLHELNLDRYLASCRDSFNIRSERVLFELSDNTGASIPKTKFEHVVRQYQHSGSFVVNINIVSEGNKCAFVTAQMLEAYFRQEGVSKLLEHTNLDSAINKALKNKIIHHVSEYTKLRFGLKPNKLQKVAVSRAVIVLFPALAINLPGKEPFDLIFNSIDGGALGIRMRNMRQANSKMTKDQNQLSFIDEAMDLTINKSMIDEEEAAAIVNETKMTLVTDENMDVIKQNLIKTIIYRSKMLTGLELNLRENFPYFFTHPSLILFDYTLRATNTYGSDINPDGFLSKWTFASQRIFDVIKDYHNVVFNSPWCNEIAEILGLLRVLPAKCTGRNLLTIKSFESASELLFVFRKTGCAINKMVNTKNKFPYIVAVGESQKLITHFYIEVEREFISIPPNFTAAEVFDLYFKLHTVFDLKFEPNLDRMMKFCEYFLYENPKVKNFRQTTGVKTLHKYLLTVPEQSTSSIDMVENETTQ